MRDQYRWFRRQFPDDVLFFQVGRFCEFYSPADDAVAGALGLRPFAANARGARFGFPLVGIEQRLSGLAAHGRAVLLVTEQPGEHLRVRRRAPAMRYLWQGQRLRVGQ